MAVVEDDPHGVVADLLERGDADRRLAADGHLLRRGVALHLGRRALDAQQLGRVAEAGTVVEVDLQRLLRSRTRISSGQGPLPLAVIGTDLVRHAFAVVERPRLLDQHDRDAVADRIGEPGLLADQLVALRS